MSMFSLSEDMLPALTRANPMSAAFGSADDLMATPAQALAPAFLMSTMPLAFAACWFGTAKGMVEAMPSLLAADFAPVADAVRKEPDNQNLKESAASADAISVAEDAPLEIAVAAPAELMPEDFVKPAGIDKPATPDDLKLISGVGPKIEKTLNTLGIWTFGQIAAWTPNEVAWVDDYLQFKGRIGRDDWIAQADALSVGGAEEYVKRFGKTPR